MIFALEEILSEPIVAAAREHYEPPVRRLKRTKIFDA
jgi:hypothetical protein